MNIFKESLKKRFPNIYNRFFKTYTLKEIYEMWAKEHYDSITPGGARSYQCAYNHIKHLEDLPFTEIKYHEWQDCINQVRAKGLHFGSQKKTKNIIGQLCKFAIKNEIAKIDYSYMLKMDKNIRAVPRTPYSEEEIIKLWDNVPRYPFIKYILILIYTGVRIGELLRVNPSEDVFLAQRCFYIRKSKTVAGTNRPVPIHRSIMPIFRELCKPDKNQVSQATYLIYDEHGKQMNYSKFTARYKKVQKLLQMDHIVHECRHTCASLLDSYGAPDVSTKKILGHAGNGVTQKV